MAAIGDAAPTLLDIAKTIDPNGRLAQVVQLMKQRSAIVEDATWMEGNMPTGHRVTSMVGLPSPTWNRVNKGVATGKHKTAQYDEACGLLEAASEVDARLQDIYGGDKFAAYRQLPSLQEYLLVDVDRQRCDLFRKGADGLWVLRLKAPFDRQVYTSPASVPLLHAARDELQLLLQRAAVPRR